MSEEMDRLTEGFGGDRESGDWSPAIDVSQKDGKLYVQAELPGMTPEDVKVEVNNDALVIQGERKSTSETNEGGVRRTERQYGSFYRSIPLPEGANADQAQAKFNNGILEITIPTPQQQNARKQITIQSEGKPPASETKPSGSTQSHAA
jgi:HSP20 family protein